MKILKNLTLFATLSIALSIPLNAVAKEPSTVSSSTEKITPYAYSVLWQRTSAERQAMCYQTYNMAGHIFAEKLNAGNFVKGQDGLLYEQRLVKNTDGTVSVNSIPVVAIFDLDETIFDNTEFFSWMYDHPYANPYTICPTFFKLQAENPKAYLLPGAFDFLKKCLDWGITPVFITNRDENSCRESSLKALRGLGLDFPNLEDNLYCYDKEKVKLQNKALLDSFAGNNMEILSQYLSDNASTKTGRRLAVISNSTVLGYFGDDLYDFPIDVPINADDSQTLKSRSDKVKQRATRFGTNWFIFPNSVWGSWMVKSFNPSNMDKVNAHISDTADKFDKFIKEAHPELK